MSLNELGPNLARIRVSKGLSQRELAKAADLDHTQIAKIEMGVSLNPRTQTLLRLRDALGVSMEEFYTTNTTTHDDTTTGNNRDEEPTHFGS